MVTGESGTEEMVVGEPRWHMASAVVAAIVLTILMPDDLRLGPTWLLPLIEGGLLVALILGDPGKIDRRIGRAPEALPRARLRADRGRAVGNGPPDLRSDQRRQGDS